MVAGAIAALQARRRGSARTPWSAPTTSRPARSRAPRLSQYATNLRGGTLELWYGGGVLDLRDATLAPEGATLKVKVVFGGGQVLVPASRKVVANVSGLGGVQDVREAKGYAADAPTLTITGTVIAGGFAIQSELDDGAAKFVEGTKSARASVDDAVETAKSKVQDATTGAKDAASDAAEAADTAATDLLETEPDTEMSPTTLTASMRRA